MGPSYLHHLMEPFLQTMRLAGHAVAEISTSAAVQSEWDGQLMYDSARVCSLFFTRILLFPRVAGWLRVCRNLSGRFTVLLGDEYRDAVEFLERSRPVARACDALASVVL
jgi:hypothetical protein